MNRHMRFLAMACAIGVLPCSQSEAAPSLANVSRPVWSPDNARLALTDAAGGLVGVCLVAYASLAWQLHQVSSLREEKAALQADVAQMQASVAALERKGGRIVLSTCGGRLCIEASSNQGQGAEQWKGANWSNKENGVQLVIPRGY